MPVRVTTANGCFAAQRPPDTASGLLAMLRSCGRHTRLGMQLTPSPSMLSRDVVCAQCVDTHELVAKRHPRPDLPEVLTTSLLDLSFGIRRWMGALHALPACDVARSHGALAPSRSSTEDLAPKGSEARVLCWSS